jgi:hypothetical protein
MSQLPSAECLLLAIYLPQFLNAGLANSMCSGNQRMSLWVLNDMYFHCDLLVSRQQLRNPACITRGRAILTF